jgi:phage terminase small subunit
MANPRTPLAKAIATGRTLKNPGRFKDRKEPANLQPLGDPPRWLQDDPAALACWHAFRREISWLTEADGALVEIASILRAQLWHRTWTLTGISALRQCLNEMGATPASRSKVAVRDTGGPTDPADEFFDPAEKYVN